MLLLLEGVAVDLVAAVDVALAAVDGLPDLADAADLAGVDLVAVDLLAALVVADFEAVDADFEAVDLAGVDLDAVDFEVVDFEAVDFEAVDLAPVALVADCDWVVFEPDLAAARAFLARVAVLERAELLRADVDCLGVVVDLADLTETVSAKGTSAGVDFDSGLSAEGAASGAAASSFNKSDRFFLVMAISSLAVLL